MFNRIQDAQPGFGIIAGQKNDFDRFFGGNPVQAQKTFDKRKGRSFFQRFLFVGDLVLPVGFLALFQEDHVRFRQIKQCA